MVRAQKMSSLLLSRMSFHHHRFLPFFPLLFCSAFQNYFSFPIRDIRDTLARGVVPRTTTFRRRRRRRHKKDTIRKYEHRGPRRWLWIVVKVVKVVGGTLWSSRQNVRRDWRHERSRESHVRRVRGDGREARDHVLAKRVVATKERRRPKVRLDAREHGVYARGKRREQRTRP